MAYPSVMLFGNITPQILRLDHQRNPTRATCSAITAATIVQSLALSGIRTQLKQLLTSRYHLHRRPMSPQLPCEPDFRKDDEDQEGLCCKPGACRIPPSPSEYDDDNHRTFEFKPSGGLFVSNAFVNGIRYRLKWSYFQRRISCKLFVENCKFWRGGGGTPLPPIRLQGECSAAHDDCALNRLNYLQNCAGIFVFGMWKLKRRRATGHLTVAEFISVSEGSSTTPHPRRLIEADFATDRLA